MFGWKKSSLNSIAKAANHGMKTKRHNASILLEPLEGRVLLSSNGLTNFYLHLTENLKHAANLTPRGAIHASFTQEGAAKTAPRGTNHFPHSIDSYTVIAPPTSNLNDSGADSSIIPGEWVVERSVGMDTPTHASEPSADLAAFFDNVGLGITFDHYLGNEAFISINSPKDVTLDQIRSALENMPGFLSVGPNYRMQLFADSGKDSSTVPGLWDISRSIGESKVNFGDAPSDDLKLFFDQVGHGITFRSYLGNEAGLTIQSPKDMTLEEVKTLMSAMPGFAGIGPVAIYHAMPTTSNSDASPSAV